jgi:hypothetical protein
LDRKPNGFNHISEINKKEKEKINNEMILYRKNNIEEQVYDNKQEEKKKIQKKISIERVLNII